MRRITSCKGRSKAVALDGPDDHDGWLAFVSGRLCISSMELTKIMASHVSAEVFERSVVKM